MAFTEKQIEIQDWLMSKHFGKWLDTRRRIELELSDKQEILCCCGKIASGLHESSCRKFQEKVTKATIAELEPLYKNQVEQKD